MKKPAKKKRLGAQQQIIVLVDSAGNYYELPRATLAACMVSDARKELVKTNLENVLSLSGYINAPAIPGSIVSNPNDDSQVLRYVGFYLGALESGR